MGLFQAIHRTFANEGEYSYDKYGRDTIYGISRFYNPDLKEIWEPLDEVILEYPSLKGYIVMNNKAPQRNNVTAEMALKVSKKLPLTRMMPHIEHFYQMKIWLPQQCEFISTQIDEELAVRLFDMSTLLGNQRAGQCLQEALNLLNRNQRDYKDVPETGNIFEMTMKAMISLKNAKVRPREDSLRMLRKNFGIRCGVYIHSRWKADPEKEAYLGQIERILFD